jgi:hypothetical protein
MKEMHAFPGQKKQEGQYVKDNHYDYAIEVTNTENQEGDLKNEESYGNPKKSQGGKK